MKTSTLALATAMIGGLLLGAGSASAAPMGPNGLNAGQSDVTQVRMMHGDRMMMKKRMMKKRMMRRRMMHRM